jgi:thiopeptide-type bacteriocin biosynthesis protein
LVKHLEPLLSRWQSAGFLIQWFLVRYADTGYHLRIRLNADPADTGFLIKGLNRILTPLAVAGLVSNFQTDVYERELERYEPAIMEDLERAFCSGTHLICQFLKNRNGNYTDAYAHFELAYASINILLRSFGYGLQDKIRLFERFYNHMQKEFKHSDKIREQLKRKFREVWNSDKFRPEHEIISQYSLARAMDYFQYTHKELALATHGWPPDKKDRLTGDMIHMHLNRIFPSASRKNETVLYYCLWRYYASEWGRQNKDLLKPLAADQLGVNDP